MNYFQNKFNINMPCIDAVHICAGSCFKTWCCVYTKKRAIEGWRWRIWSQDNNKYCFTKVEFSTSNHTCNMTLQQYHYKYMCLQTQMCRFAHSYCTWPVWILIKISHRDYFAKKMAGCQKSSESGYSFSRSYYDLPALVYLCNSCFCFCSLGL